MKHYTDYSLKSLHTFGMDVRAAHFVEYSSVNELRELLSRMYTEWQELPWLHIGGGSNLLFASDFYNGLILHSAIKGWQVVHEDETCVHLRVGAGVVWDDLVAYTVSQGWGGMENLSLIPGEVGASAVQNIGAYGVEAKDLIVDVETIESASGVPYTFDCKSCDYGYRASFFKKKENRGRFIVTHVIYRLQKNPVFRLDYGNIRAELERMGEGVTLESVRRAVINIRESKLPNPRVMGNAGSFFMNPIVPRGVMTHIRKTYPDVPFYEVDGEHVKIPAGWMIEQCGWKGRAMGNAAVHDKQALVLVNLGRATGQEVMDLSDAICHDVLEKFGVRLHPEVNFVK